MNTTMKRAVDIEVYPVRSEDLDPKDFIDLVERNPGLIGRSTIVPPRLGSRGFGRIHVEYTRPLYKTLPAFKPVSR